MTTLQVISGSGEFQTRETAIHMTAPEDLQLVWSTEVKGAAGGQWRVTRPQIRGGKQLVASGQATPAPLMGKEAMFTIAAGAFLEDMPPKSPGVQYSITIIPTDAANQPMGQVSLAVKVRQKKGSPQPPVDFGPGVDFPDLELVHYAEQIGQVPLTQLRYATATVRIRAVNHLKQGTTDPVSVSVTDFNVLMRQRGPGGVGAEFGARRVDGGDGGDGGHPAAAEVAAARGAAVQRVACAL